MSKIRPCRFAALVMLVEKWKTFCFSGVSPIRPESGQIWPARQAAECFRYSHLRVQYSTRRSALGLGKRRPNNLIALP
jgi:hypothetical protein